MFEFLRICFKMLESFRPTHEHVFQSI